MSAYPKLRELIDRFYRSDYDVWAGELEAEMLAGESAKALRRLKERPGVFARSLFVCGKMCGGGFERCLFDSLSHLFELLGGIVRRQRVGRDIDHASAGEVHATACVGAEIGLVFNIPVPVGDRSETVHDKTGALQGQRFKVDGDHVRLFMEWGRGLPAAHIDMDLSGRRAGLWQDWERLCLQPWRPSTGRRPLPCADCLPRISTWT